MSHVGADRPLVSIGNVPHFSSFGVEITERAVAELQKLGVGGERFLRVNTTAGGCSGTTYDAAIDTELADGDVVLFDKDDVRLVTDRTRALFLQGLQVDYSDDLIQAGFKLSNPNATSSCGCGSSFTS